MKRRIKDFQQRNISYGEIMALQQEFETQLDEHGVIFDDDEDYDEALNDFIQQYMDGNDDPQIDFSMAKVRPVRDSKRRWVRDGRSDGRGIDFDDYNCLVSNYGHLLSLDDVTGGDEFADLIKRTYSLDNERNAYFYELAKNLMFVTRHRNGFNYYVSDSCRPDRNMRRRVKDSDENSIKSAIDEMVAEYFPDLTVNEYGIIKNTKGYKGGLLALADIDGCDAYVFETEQDAYDYILNGNGADYVADMMPEDEMVDYLANGIDYYEAEELVMNHDWQGIAERILNIEGAEWFLSVYDGEVYNVGGYVIYY